jgi:hypothetical protein
MITWRGFSQTTPWISRSAQALRIHTFQLDGYLGFDDSEATETTFAALAETVCNALDDDTTLNSDAMSKHRDPTQLVIDERTFYQHLCHHAQITLQVAEIV